jgi:hypothetical protein
MTRTELIAFTREVADMVDSPRWSDDSISVLLGLAQWQEIAGLLNANRMYYINTLTPTQDSSGQFDVADLTSGSGNSVKNFYRVLTMAQPNTGAGTAQLYYREASFEEYPNPQPSTSLPYVWYRFGDTIQILPAVDGQQMSVVVNYRPCRVDLLAADSDDVPFPNGYETILAYCAGARMLDKGGAESGAANALLSNAEDIRQGMLMDLGRSSTMPTIARAFDSRLDWGSG